MRNLALSLGCLILSSTCLAQNLTWVQIKTSGPSKRCCHAMAHDSKRQRTVLFGGYNGQVMSDTWEWDGRSWTQLKPKTIPTARCCHELPWDMRVVGMSGCTLYASADVMLFVGNSDGSASVGFTVPNDSNLINLVYFNQAYVPDATLGPFGASMSNAAEATVGSR